MNIERNRKSMADPYGYDDDMDNYFYDQHEMMEEKNNYKSAKKPIFNNGKVIMAEC